MGPFQLASDSDKIVQQGEQIYKANCASCHGTNLEGEQNWRTPKPDGGRRAPPHNVSGHTWHHPDEFLFNITKFGSPQPDTAVQNGMPAYQSILSDQEIIAVLSYIKSTWPADLKEYHDYLNSQGKMTNN